MIRQIGPPIRFRNPLRRPENRGSGSPSLNEARGPPVPRRLLAYAAVFAQSRRPAPKGFLRERAEPLTVVHE